MTQSRMGSLSKPSFPCLCALGMMREKRKMLFPSLLPPASQGQAPLCRHPAGCPVANKVAFCRPALCYLCPCSQQLRTLPAILQPFPEVCGPRAGTARPGLFSPSHAVRSHYCLSGLRACCILTMPSVGATGLAGHSISKANKPR